MVGRRLDAVTGMVVDRRVGQPGAGDQWLV